MKYNYFIISFFLVFSTTVVSQIDGIEIIEKKQGKRIVLSAKNTTNDTINAFLLIQASGFRKSATIPIVKNVPPMGTEYMTTLIELAGVESTYSYELFLNPRETPLTIKREKKITDISAALDNKLVLFITEECEKCTALVNALKESRITFQKFDVKKDKNALKQFEAFLKKDLTQTTLVRYPVIWNKDHILYGFNDLATIVQKLSK